MCQPEPHRIITSDTCVYVDLQSTPNLTSERLAIAQKERKRKFKTILNATELKRCTYFLRGISKEVMDIVLTNKYFRPKTVMIQLFSSLVWYLDD